MPKKLIKYRAASEGVRNAFFKWKKMTQEHSYNVVAFVAGLNAAKQEFENKKKEV